MDRKLFAYSIVASILASILFVWLLEPLTRWILQAAADSAAGWRIWLQNRVFRIAARGGEGFTTHLTLLLVVGIFIVISGAVTIYSTLTVLLRQLGFALRIEPLVKKINLQRFGLIALVINFFTLLSLYISLLLSLFLSSADIRLNSSFKQRLAAIGPYLDAVEEKRLKSAWALMHDRHDYVKINAQMEKHAQEAKIDLPVALYE